MVDEGFKEKTNYSICRFFAEQIENKFPHLNLSTQKKETRNSDGEKRVNIQFTTSYSTPTHCWNFPSKQIIESHQYEEYIITYIHR